MPVMSRFTIGVASAVAAQFMWGLFPLYWKLLAHVPPLEVLSHRNIWCAVCLSVLVLCSESRRQIVARVLVSRAELARHFFSSCLIAANWLVYIWAVVNGHVIDASLGYSLSPLVSVALGYLVFGERPVYRQWLALLLAVAGVLVMIIASGVVPWIGLSLATTFGLYGMTRKQASTGPVNGLFLETLLLVPASLAAIWWLSLSGAVVFSQPFSVTEIWLVLGGLVTAVPLVLYAQGARSLPLSVSGLLVFITPTIQFLVGWLIYRESIAPATWAGFVCIWTALVIYGLTLRGGTAGRKAGAD